jgi:hypothetical protein
MDRALRRIADYYEYTGDQEFLAETRLWRERRQLRRRDCATKGHLIYVVPFYDTPTWAICDACGEQWQIETISSWLLN